MKKGTVKLLSLVIVIAMVTALFPMGLTVSAATGNITNITVNAARPVTNTGGNQIKVVTNPAVSADGNFSVGDRTTMTFAHMGAKIKGLTQIITPINDSNRAGLDTTTAGANMKNFLLSTQEYFNFTADQPGAVIVVSAINLHNQSDTANFKNNYSSWACVANAVYAALPTGYTDWRLAPVDYEPTTPYYFTKFQWNSESLCATGTPKLPDVTLQKSNQITTNFAGNVKYPYAYKKYFAANTPVSIPVIGTYSSNETMAVFVDWNDVEAYNAKLSSFTYTPNGGNATAVNGFTATDEGGTYNVVLPLGTTSVTMNPKSVATLASLTKSPSNDVVDVSSGSGTYTINVVSGSYNNTYTVHFTVNDKSANAKLSSLTYTANGTTAAVTGFDPANNGGAYNIALPEGTLSVSNVTGVVADTGKASIAYDKTSLSKFPGGIVATVTAEDGTKNTFTVYFDLPGYLLNDDFDRHGDVGAIIANKVGSWSYAAAVKDTNGNYNEYMVIAADPKDPTNKVAKHTSDYSATKWPSLKKDAAFTQTTVDSQTVWSPLVISGDTMINKKGGPESYLEFRYKSGGGTTSIGRTLAFASTGSITFQGVDTGYRWTPGEWSHYVFTIFPNPTDISKTPVKVVVSGNVTDTNGKPAVYENSYVVDMTKADYVTTGYINIMLNCAIPITGADAAVYTDNTKIYTPSASTVSISDHTNVSVNGGVELDLSKFDFDPATLKPDNISVTSGSDTVSVWDIKYDAFNYNKFKLYFNHSLADNTTYTVALNGVKDLGGNAITGTPTFTTKAADLLTGISISSDGNLEQVYGVSSKVVFTADTTPLDNVSTNNIVWSVNGTQAGTGKYFAFTPDTVGLFSISVSVTGNPLINPTPVVVAVAKGTQNAPAAIEVAKTYNTITITPVEGAEYGVKLKSSADEVVYGTNNVFAGLQSETEYTAYVRMAATALYNPSAAVTADVTTEVAPVLVPSVTVNDVANTIVDLDLLTMEYAVSTNGGTTYGDYTSDAPAAFGGSVKVKVRYKETETLPAGEDVILTFTPNYGDVSGDGIIDISDVIMAAEIAVGVSNYTTEQIKRANVSDKVIMTVDISDVVMIAERAVGGTTTFPIDL